jgi:hypothetical protein
MSADVHRIRAEDLAEVTVAEIPEATTRQAPASKRRGRGKRPSKYLIAIAQAKAIAEKKGMNPETIDGTKVQVGDYALYPPDGQPTVGYEARKGLADEFGSGSAFHKEKGFYYEVLLRDVERKPSVSTGKSKRGKGVLYVRQVVPVEVDEYQGLIDDIAFCAEEPGS